MFKPLYFSFLLIVALSLSNASSAGVDQAAPKCQAPTLKEQKPLDLPSYRGKVVYMDFWASWCPPCRTSFPLLNALHNELQGRGFEVIAVNVDENREDLMHFIEQVPVDFTIAADPDGECPQAYDVVAMPSSYLIDKQGIIRYVHHGFHKKDIGAIRELVLALLAEPPRP
jgi:peroxiredoxin